MENVLNYALSRLQLGDRSIFIAGHGRSGNSWIGSTFAKAPGILYYDEPCNPNAAKDGDYSYWFKYIKPNERDSYFESCLDRAFKGLITYGKHWLTQPYRRLLPGYRVVITEVASLMSLEWVYKRYQPKILYVVRHPCAIALSERNKNTPTERSIKEILKQTDLVKNHLNPYIIIMEKAKKPFEIYGAVWGARNRVIADLITKYPEWKTVFYEDLCNDPVGCFRELFDNFNLTWTSNVQKYINQSTTKEKPGKYSTYRITKNQIGKWKIEMTQDEIDQVRSFVEPFNLPFYNQESDWSLE
jgi:Sulfotransferase domain